MATHTIVTEYSAGATIYFALWSGANVFDFDDNTFTLPGSAVTPGVAMGETVVGAGVSKYEGSLDLADLAPGLAPVTAIIGVYVQAGGAPAPVTDTRIGLPTVLEAQLGEIGLRQIEVKTAVCTKTTAGTTIQLFAELLADGEPVPLYDIDPAATCTVDVKQHPDAPLFAMNAAAVGAVNTSHRFAAEYNNPGFTADRLYVATFTITADGETYVRDHTITVVP